MWKKNHFKKFAAGGLASRQWSLKKIQRLGLSCWRAPYTVSLSGLSSLPSLKEVLIVDKDRRYSKQLVEDVRAQLTRNNPNNKPVLKYIILLSDDEPLSSVVSRSSVSFPFLCSCFISPPILFFRLQRFPVFYYVCESEYCNWHACFILHAVRIGRCN